MSRAPPSQYSLRKTPSGAQVKTAPTQGQVQQIQSEYDQLQAQIWTLQRKKRGETVKVPITKTAIVLIRGLVAVPDV